jgi:WhiB family transcriptional regulator, redox-sensing transcriptional regulator
VVVVNVIHVPITDVPQPGPWNRKARCRTAPTSVFFPTQGDDVGQAKAICRGCPVLAECREYALTYPSLQGVWAAMSEQERERMHQRAAS